MVSCSTVSKFFVLFFLCSFLAVEAAKTKTVAADVAGDEEIDDEDEDEGPMPPRRKKKEKKDPLANVINAELLVKTAKRYSPIVNFERRAKDLAKYYSYFTHEYNEKTNGKKELLCSSIIALNSDSVDDAIKNVKSSDNKCDFQFVVYKVDEAEKQGLIDSFNAKLVPVMELLKAKLPAGKAPIEVVLEFAPPRTELLGTIQGLCDTYVARDIHNINNATHAENIERKQLSVKDVEFLTSYNPCDLSAFPLLDTSHEEAAAAAEVPYNTVIYPKILMFFSYLKFVQKYNYIWALDGDLSLSGMDMQEFMESFKCSFPTSPLVLQPTIAENTQKYSYLNAIGWNYVNDKEEEATGRTVKSAVSGFIEIQAPLFNSFFLEFYIMGFILPMAQPTYILGADWGFDEIFCKTAKFFAKSALKNPYVPMSLQGTIPCAIVVTSPINHKDSNEIAESLGTSNKFAVNVELVKIISAAFSSYNQGGNAQVSNPIESKELLRVFELQPNCAHKY